MHHIVSDGWSIGVMIKEFAHLYEAFREGKPSPLPEFEVQYADYAVWQREWLREKCCSVSWSTGGSSWKGYRCWSCRPIAQGRR